jgi:replicative DNA helicase
MSLEAEYAVIGSLLVDNASFWRVADKVTADDFTGAENRALFTALAAGIKSGVTVDPFTLEVSHGKAAFDLAMKLAQTQASVANVAAHADIVRRQGEARRLRTAGEAITRCSSFEEAQAALSKVRPAQSARIKTAKDGLGEMVEALQRRYDADGSVSGVATGLESLDALTSGYQPGNLIIVAARPGMGKSAFALQSAIAAGRTFYASLEMTAGELMERAVANMGALPHRWLRFPLEAPDHASALVLSTSRKVAELGLLMDDQSGITADACYSRIRQAHMAEPLRLAVIDHLGLFDRPGKHDPSEIGLITSGAKRLAKDLGIPVILLCQLNRGLESRTDKRPQLADLRDSGRIEEDADVVIGLYRDEYYNPNGPLAGYLEAIVLKNRSGEKGTAWAKSLLSMMRLESCNEPERPVEQAGSNNGNGGFKTGRGTGQGSRYQSRVDGNHG